MSALGELLTSSPLVALIPAAGFLLAWYACGLRLALGAGLCWSLYAGYEQLMKARILCSGECDIRIDLLGIYPALLLLSAGAVIAIALRLLTSAAPHRR
jgi:hypothetical protein